MSARQIERKRIALNRKMIVRKDVAHAAHGLARPDGADWDIPMTCFDPDRPREPILDDVVRTEEDRRLSPPLPGTALRTLDKVAEALGIATALLYPSTRSERPCDGPASLMEAGALLRAFIRIEDRETRLRCVAFVQAASMEGGNA